MVDSHCDLHCLFKSMFNIDSSTILADILNNYYLIILHVPSSVGLKIIWNSQVWIIFINQLNMFKLFFLFSSPQEAVKMARKTSVINEGTIICHHNIEKRTYTRTFFGGRKNGWIRTNDAACWANRGCFSQAELFFMELAMKNKGCKTDFQQIRQTRPSPSLSHITSPAYISVCDFSSVQFHFGKNKTT